MIKFPNGFFWGSATSGPQTESSNGRSKQVMDYFYDKQKFRFFNGMNVKGNLESRYTEYNDIAHNLNFNSLRTSIQWSRLIPDGKNVSKEAIDFYRKYFIDMKSKGVEPFINLMHFDMPMWAQEIGGWENKKVIDKYVEYAKVAFDNFGDIIKTWFTFNEPIVPVEGGYLYDFHYPNKVDMKAAMQVQFNSLMAHIKTVNLFKENNYEGEIGIILNITPAIPRSQNIADIKAAEWAEIFQSKTFLDPIIKGDYPQKVIDEAKKRGYMFDASLDEFKLIKDSPKIDLLGINFYQPQRVKALDYLPNWESGAITFSYYYSNYEMPGRKMNLYRGWEIYPESIYEALKNIQNNYGNIKTFISENGMGVEDEEKFKDQNGVINDHYRIDFLEDHLQYVHKAIIEGANCVGFHMWTYIDNWSWMNAYKNRYGFVEFNLKENKFVEKKSANWIRNVIKNNGF